MTLPPLVAGNWKMNGLTASLAEVRAIREGVAAGVAGQAEIVICPPATLLMATAEACRGSTIGLGGQDCRAEASGAFTGDISAAMLRDAGATYVILGHSERRKGHGETDAAIKAKAASALTAGLKAIICVGETQRERDTGRAIDIVAGQLAGSLPARADAATLVVAYEPIWAIGTGAVPTTAQVAEMHALIRERLVTVVPDGGSVRILYGGSVKPDNATTLMAIDNVNGALVGGASLKARDFLAIAAAYRKG